MTDERFTELVNLFLDNEITPCDLSELEQILRKDPARRERFNERCRLDRAMRLALKSEASAAASWRAKGLRTVTFPAVAFAFALTVAFALGFALIPVVERIIGVPSEAEVESASTGLERFNPERYEVRKQIAVAERPNGASLAAYYRVAGLRPEVVPKDARFRRVPIPRLTKKPETLNLVPLYVYFPELLGYSAPEFTVRPGLQPEPAKLFLVEEELPTFGKPEGPVFRASLVDF